MKQIFQIEWVGGSLTSELIAALIIDYFSKMNLPYQAITVSELRIMAENSKCICKGTS
jgi:hypothetical protein